MTYPWNLRFNEGSVTFVQIVFQVQKFMGTFEQLAQEQRDLTPEKVGYLYILLLLPSLDESAFHAWCGCLWVSKCRASYTNFARSVWPLALSVWLLILVTVFPHSSIHAKSSKPKHLQVTAFTAEELTTVIWVIFAVKSFVVTKEYENETRKIFHAHSKWMKGS